MAPTFLQKLAKAANPNGNNSSDKRERASADGYSAAATDSTLNDSLRGRNRAKSASSGSSTNLVGSPTTPTQASTSLRNSTSRRSSVSTGFGAAAEGRIPSIITTLSGTLNRRRAQSKEKKKEKKEREKERSRSRTRLGADLQPTVSGNRQSWASIDTQSTQHNFTIIPPSPLVANDDLDSSASEDEADHTEDEQEHQVSSSSQDNFNYHSTPVDGDFKDNKDAPHRQEEPQDVVTPTAGTHGSSNNPDSGPSKPVLVSYNTASTITASSTTSKRPSTAGSTTNTTATSPTTASSFTSAIMSTLAPGLGGYQIRKRASDKSVAASAKKGAPPEINIVAAAAPVAAGASSAGTSGGSVTYASANSGNWLGGAAGPGHHVRAATAPAAGMHMDGGEEGEDANRAVTMLPIVDSPTDVKFPSGIPPGVNGSSNGSPHQPAAPSVISPSVSMSSSSTTNLPSTNGDGKKRPWRRSTTRKPTGLASALAASGMAMVNPAFSPPPLPTTTANSSKGSDKLPYISRSPAQSTTGHTKSRKSSTTSVTGKGGKRQRRPSSSKSDAVTSPARSRSRSASASASDPANPTNGSSLHLRPDYYSSLGLDLDDSGSDVSGSDSESGSDDGSSSGLDLEDVDDLHIPVTGFAVASNKRNADFHELFPTVPEGDYLIEDYGCALQREILIQGRIYISENHICFHANIFGWITDLSIPIYEITSLEKKMTAFVIPNAIQLTTRQSKYTFASFLSRDTTFDVIFNIWKLARPSEEKEGSFLSSGRGSLEGAVAGPGGGSLGAGGAGGVVAAGAGEAVSAAMARKATQCTCGKENKHFTETAMEITVPGTPEKIYNLMFASGFIKEFMSGNQKLLDIQISDWAPVSPGSKLLTRNMSYIKPLNGSLGPKQTKCELRDEMVFCDFEQYVSTVTTTRTPDVPSGGVFSVMTRTCITWAGPITTKVLVTTQVDWTGRSFIKGIIERSAIEGQRVYHVELERAMRAYIQEHNSEFLPEGIDAAVALAPAPEAAVDAGTPAVIGITEKQPTPEQLKQRERERNARGLQWAWDTFDGAWQVAGRSTKGALELIRDAWDQSTSTTILWFVIVILVLSNLWTLMRVGSRHEEADRKLEAKRTTEREKWVQSIVTALWDELAAGKAGPGAGVRLPGQVGVATTPIPAPTGGADVHAVLEQIPLGVPVPPSLFPFVDSAGVAEPKPWAAEVQHLLDTLDVVELRVAAIRTALKKVNSEEMNALD